MENPHTGLKGLLSARFEKISPNRHFLFFGTLNQPSEQKQCLKATTAFALGLIRKWILIHFGQIELFLSTLKIPHNGRLYIVISWIFKA